MGMSKFDSKPRILATMAKLLLANLVEFSMAILTLSTSVDVKEKKEVMLRVFWGKVKYIEGILGI
jgi:hypothetical protein